jgi:hypothetical protein
MTPRTVSTVVSSTALLWAACGSNGGTVDAGHCLSSKNDQGQLLFKVESANNYTFSSSLSISVTKVNPSSELFLDWSGLTKDIVGHPVNPLSDVDMVMLVVWNISHQELEQKLNQDDLGSLHHGSAEDAAIVPRQRPSHRRPCPGGLPDLLPVGGSHPRTLGPTVLPSRCRGQLGVCQDPFARAPQALAQLASLVVDGAHRPVARRRRTGRPTLVAGCSVSPPRPRTPSVRAALRARPLPKRGRAGPWNSEGNRQARHRGRVAARALARTKGTSAGRALTVKPGAAVMQEGALVGKTSSRSLQRLDDAAELGSVVTRRGQLQVMQVRLLGGPAMSLILFSAADEHIGIG